MRKIRYIYPPQSLTRKAACSNDKLNSCQKVPRRLLQARKYCQYSYLAMYKHSKGQGWTAQGLIRHWQSNRHAQKAVLKIASVLSEIHKICQSMSIGLSRLEPHAAQYAHSSVSATCKFVQICLGCSLLAGATTTATAITFTGTTSTCNKTTNNTIRYVPPQLLL